MAYNIKMAVWFVVAFYIFLIWLPAKIMRYRLIDKRNGIENHIKAFIISNVVVINGVFLLSFLHIYNRAYFYVYYVIAGIVICKLRGASLKHWCKAVYETILHVMKGHYKISLYIRRGIKQLGSENKRVSTSIFHWIFNRDFMINIIFIGSIVALIYRRFKLVFANYAYLTSDMYVHNEWINNLERGNIFCDGVYPFGKHNMITGFRYLAGLNTNIVMRYYGPTLSILMIIVLYWFIRKIVHCKNLAIISILIYCVTNFSFYPYSFRLGYTLPQEVGMIFLLPCAYFLGKFLRDGRKGDAYYFILSAGLIFSIHFYTLFFAVFICMAICIVFIKTIWNKKTIIQLLLCGAGIFIVGFLPMGTGLAQGRYWQGSTSWALGVMSNKSKQVTAGNDNQSNAVQKKQSAKANQTKRRNIFQKIGYAFSQTVLKQVEDMAPGWGIVFWICMLLSILLLIAKRFLLKKSLDWKNQMQFSIWVFLCIVVIVYASWAFGLPTLLQEIRIRMFLGYIAPIIFIIPFETLMQIIGNIGLPVSYVVAYGLSLVIIATTVGKPLPMQTYFYLEPSLAAQACVKIQKEYKKNTWTVVSPVEETSLLCNSGYHYELWQFISQMEHYKNTMQCYIPTKYVFFILEKKPLQYNQFRTSDTVYDDPGFSTNDARPILTKEMLGITNDSVMKYYSKYDIRKSLEAKMYYWVQTYQKYFPDQFKVYMEDDECIVYRFQQNEFATNNLAIPYTYNEVTDQEYKQALKEQNKLRKEEAKMQQQQ